jgi:hypothetical protein
MSFEEELEKAARELAKEKAGAWRLKPKWLAIIGITRENLIKGTGCIEKLAFPPWDKRLAPQKAGGLVGFGKHANLTYKELKEKHFGYYSWACENIKGFKEKSEPFL